MPREFKLPDLGEGIHEGEIVDVLVSVGDKVEDGQPVLVVETDKATTEVPAPVTGVVKEIRVSSGDMVHVGDVLIVFTVEGEEAEEAERPPGKPSEEREAPERAAKEEADREERRKAAEAEKEKAERPPEAEAPPEREEPVPAAPSTRRLARELGVDLRLVKPSGPGGRVTSEDVRSYAEESKKPAEEPRKPPEERRRPPEERAPMRPFVEAGPLPDFSQWGAVEREPLRSVRRATARRMTQAWSQIPHVTHQDVADITDLEAFRNKYKDQIESQGGALSLTVFALKAAVAALKAHPRFNASLDLENEEIILKRYYHIGVAVDTDRGLVVPVIRDVDRKGVVELAKELNDLVHRIRNGKIDRDDVAGGTFTITNIGPLGGTGFSPIVNYPQVAILGLAQARLQPVVKGDLKKYDIVPRLMLPVLVGFDHRVVDGADAARFMGMIIEALENPEKLLIM